MHSEWVIMSDGLPIGFFGDDKETAIDALKYVRHGFVIRREV